MSWVEAAQVVGGLTGLSGIVSVALYRHQKRKYDVDTAKAVTESALELLTPYKDQIHELQRELAGHRQELARARQSVRAMSDQLDKAHEEARLHRRQAQELTGRMESMQAEMATMQDRVSQMAKELQAYREQWGPIGGDER